MRQKYLYPFVLAGLLLCFACPPQSETKQVDDEHLETLKDIILDTKKIDWQWDESNAQDRIEVAGTSYSYSYESGKVLKIIRKPATEASTVIWTSQRPMENTIAFASDGKALYAAVYTNTFTGCRVLSLDLLSGAVNWERRAAGLESIGHSKYSNRVQLHWIEGELVLFGWESAGKYVEKMTDEF